MNALIPSGNKQRYKKRDVRDGMIGRILNDKRSCSIENNELNELIRKAKAGDGKARERIVYSFSQVAFKQAMNYPRHCDTEEYFQLALIEFSKAIDSFDETRGYKFFPYAVTCIKNKHYAERLNGKTAIKIPSWAKSVPHQMTLSPNPSSSFTGLDGFSSNRTIEEVISLESEVDNDRDGPINSEQVNLIVSAAMKKVLRKNSKNPRLGLWKEIASRRLLADEPATLEELGQENNLTRESIRLHEKKILKELINVLPKDAAQAI